MPKNKVDLGELYYKQRGCCYWCKRPMILGGTGDLSATREHLVPQSRGGKAFVKKDGRRVRNIVAACNRCNALRGSMDAHTFRTQCAPHKPTSRDQMMIGDAHAEGDS